MTTPARFSATELKACRICGSSNLERYIDLGRQPPSNSFVTPEQIAQEVAFPLAVLLCAECGLSQLDHVVSAQSIFDDYDYLSSTSKALCNHYQGLVDGALRDFEPPASGLAVDIGCNDGIMLKRYPVGRIRVLGVEPSSAGKYAVAAGFDVIKGFFTESLGSEIARSHGPASLITVTNVFAHVDDIRSFTLGVSKLLDRDGVFVIEFPYVREMVDRLYFDTIYHEHLCYLGLRPLERLFADCGLKAFRVEAVEIGASGPALRLFVGRRDGKHSEQESIRALRAAEEGWGINRLEPYRTFALRVSTFRDQLLGLIESVSNEGVGAYGAPAKGNTMLNYLGVTAGVVQCVAENNELKIGKLTPGSHIPIVSDAEFLKRGLPHALLLTWNYAEYFLANSPYVKTGGKFILPFPKPQVRP